MKKNQQGLVIFWVLFFIGFVTTPLQAKVPWFCKAGGSGRIGGYIHISSGGGEADKLIIFILLSSTTSTIACMTTDSPRYNSKKKDKKRRKESRPYGSLIDNKNYFAFNLNQIKKEATQGRGENLSLLAHLFGCSQRGEAHFSQALQKNYQKLFYSSSDLSAEKFASNLETLIHNEPLLNKECSYES